MASGWLAGLPNEITFVMVDASNNELTGLTLSIQVRVTGGSFQAAAGSWIEISNGWYSYTCTAGEAVVGPVSVKVTAATAVQQNLEYVCEQRTPGVSFWPYTVTREGVGTPIAGVLVWVTTDAAGSNPSIWTGYTDAAGEAKDTRGNDPLLPLGNNYFWKYLPGWTDVQNPDLEVVT